MVAPRAHHHHHSHSTIPTLVDEDIYPLLGGHPFDFLLACFILNAVGQCFLLLLTATLLFSNGIRKRNWTLINLLIVSILSSIPPSLLFYSGSFMNPAPPLALCLTQAVLKHGSDTMFSIASLALVIEFLQGTGILITKFISKNYIKLPLLIATPYVAFVLFAALTAGVQQLGATHLKKVHHPKNLYYCTIDYQPLNHTLNIFCIVILAFTVLLEVYTFYMLRREWRRVDGRPVGVSFSLSQCLRVAGFTLLQLGNVVALAFSFYIQSAGTHIVPILYDALIPLVTFLIFGTTNDCVMAWTCSTRRNGFVETAPLLPITGITSFSSPQFASSSIRFPSVSTLEIAPDKPLPPLPPPPTRDSKTFLLTLSLPPDGFMVDFNL